MSVRVHAYTVGASASSKTRYSLRQAPAGVEDDAQRVGACHVARGELRVVGRDRAGADDHDIAERAHAVQVEDVLGTGYKLRLARVHRDETVEALAQVADRDRFHRRRAANRQVQVEQTAGRIAGRKAGAPAAAGLPDDDCVRMPDRHASQPRGGVIPGKGGGFGSAGQPIGVVGCGERDAPRAIRSVFAGRAGGWLHCL